jgi:anthranilate synthase component 1
MTTQTFTATTKHLQADLLTPVGIYLRLRDSYPQSILLECTEYNSRTNAFSYICANPLVGIEVDNEGVFIKQNGNRTLFSGINNTVDGVSQLAASIKIEGDMDQNLMPGLFGFTTYDAINLFDNVDIAVDKSKNIPYIKYDLYQIVIAFNHFTNTLSITELLPEDGESTMNRVINSLNNKNSTPYPFILTGDEQSNITDNQYKELVNKGKHYCAIGDVFQIVLSRQFTRAYKGDEFNVYRALRTINPSPYLFFFDYSRYKLFGSSPEAQLKVSDGEATINPIAGTTKKTGDALNDALSLTAMVNSVKENSEHAMLVDLARNDLSRSCSEVKVDSYKEVHSYSHLYHLVSTVKGKINGDTKPYQLLADTFPAGTLSGAPKHRAVKLISELEGTPRGFYGGSIGFMGLNGSLNHAIMIRSFCCHKNIITYQAGAGVVIGSTPEGELAEVNNKIAALRQAMEQADLNE